MDKLKDPEGGLTKELLSKCGFNEYELNFKIWNLTHPPEAQAPESYGKRKEGWTIRESRKDFCLQYLLPHLNTDEDEYLIVPLVVNVERQIKIVTTIVGTGSPKSFVTANASGILSPVRDLERSIWDRSISGWVTGKIHSKPVSFKCYGLAPDSQLDKMDKQLLLGYKALKTNDITIDTASGEIKL